MQITTEVLNSVRYALQQSAFGESAFKLDLPAAGFTVLRITFADQPHFEFLVTKDRTLRVRYSPGHLVMKEEYEVEKLNHIVASVDLWCRHILTELRASNPLLNPIYCEMDRLKAEFERRLDECFENANQHFSNAESEDLSSRLSAVEENFSQLREQSRITEEELAKVKQTLAHLKENLKVMPKKTWMRMAGTKIIELGGKILSSESGQKLLLDVSQRLLEKGGKLPGV
jgi:hypothetical protein